MKALMHLVSSFAEFAESYERERNARPVVTVGSFDGVHLGHQYLINELINWGQREHAPSALITFKEHPRTFMTGEEIKRITPISQKAKIFEELGVDIVLVIDFNEELRDTSARAFCEHFLCGALNARGMLLGHNNRIGRGREGTPEAIAEFAPDLGFELRLADGLEVGGISISSSAIRAHIEEGDFIWARKMLGRPYAIVGEVTQGNQIGRTIGFPTINLPLATLVHPPKGVYGVQISIAGKTHIGAANIGVRPTVDDSRVEPLLEVHVFDFDKDVYGQEVEVEFAFRVRDEVKFAGLEALKKQLADDCEAIRRGFEEPWAKEG